MTDTDAPAAAARKKDAKTPTTYLILTSEDGKTWKLEEGQIITGSGSKRAISIWKQPFEEGNRTDETPPAYAVAVALSSWAPLPLSKEVQTRIKVG